MKVLLETETIHVYGLNKLGLTAREWRTIGYMAGTYEKKLQARKIAKRLPWPDNYHLVEVIEKEFVWKAQASLKLIDWKDSEFERRCFENLRNDFKLKDVLSKPKLVIAQLYKCRQTFRVFGHCNRKLAFLPKDLMINIGKYL
jgi:hypothetical protein